jgi:ribosomal protein S18 acetylase RimI-like enzyme
MPDTCARRSHGDAAVSRTTKSAEHTHSIVAGDGSEGRMILYRVKSELDVNEVIDVLRSSTLGARRPIDDVERMGAMLRRANLIVTAWDDERLVGIARSLSDFAFCTYLSDLAVRAEYQRKGIGKELLRRTQAEGGQATVFLFAAPAAVDYYRHIGFAEGSGWMLQATECIR